MGENNSVLTLEHLQWFGLIIQGFARAEHIMQEILGRLHGVRSNSVIMLTVGLSYREKRDALLASLRAFNVPANERERIRWYLGEIQKHSALRNAIAHTNWVAGTRPASVRPNYMDTRNGVLKLLGFGADERDYTLPELEALARELIARMDAFDVYRREHGYVPLPNRRRAASR